MAVDRRHALARIDHEQRDVGLVERALGLRPHAAGKRLGRRLFEPGGVDQPEVEIGDMPLALAAVAGHPGQIVDQRQLAADEPVEQRRLADIRPADDRDREAIDDHAASRRRSR